MAMGQWACAASVAAWLMLGPAMAQASGGEQPAPPVPGGETGAIERPKFDLEKALDAARQTVQRFKDRLKGELAAAIKSEGAANAISLCQTIAPDISTELTDASGFEVLRTSLKLRNPENAPGPWELEVLKSFQDKAATGAEPDKLEYYAEVVTPEGDRLLRYMRGIQVGEICLSCHGIDIKPDVKAELVRYYPDDKATGYKLGELRGAFSLVKLIE
jgi:hypothetical protein